MKVEGRVPCRCDYEVQTEAERLRRCLERFRIKCLQRADRRARGRAMAILAMLKHERDARGTLLGPCAARNASTSIRTALAAKFWGFVRS